MIKRRKTILLISIVSASLTGIAQQKITRPDLSVSTGFRAVNRDITISGDGLKKNVVHLNSKPDNGVAWINGVSFQTGVIELDIKGKNVQQQSFVGISFHGLNDSTYDAIYFRPFNFQSPDTLRKSHSVQYISLPKNDWSILREKHPGMYENALSKTIDPDNWFHAKIFIEAGNITVYVNDDKISSLQIKPIATRTTGKVGFWVGNNAAGDFANLSIQNN